jgi:hypothetical protein
LHFLNQKSEQFCQPIPEQIHIEKLPRYLLPIKPGDCVSYVLAMSAGPASAITAKLLSFSSRSESEVFDFFEKAARILDTSAANQVKHFNESEHLNTKI